MKLGGFKWSEDDTPDSCGLAHPDPPRGEVLALPLIRPRLAQHLGRTHRPRGRGATAHPVALLTERDRRPPRHPRHGQSDRPASGPALRFRGQKRARPQSSGIFAFTIRRQQATEKRKKPAARMGGRIVLCGIRSVGKNLPVVVDNVVLAQGSGVAVVLSRVDGTWWRLPLGQAEKLPYLISPPAKI